MRPIAYYLVEAFPICGFPNKKIFSKETIMKSFWQFVKVCLSKFVSVFIHELSYHVSKDLF